MELMYSSTRNDQVKMTASQAILKGLADDGGLFVPERIPALSVSLDELAKMSYQETAYVVMKEFFTDSTEEELKAFRQAYTIEVFREGKTYYSQVITDKWLETNTIQRNTVYQLNVKNIYNVGADVPNGEPDENKPMYYLDVEVSVNPWVLSTQDVNLGE